MSLGSIETAVICPYASHCVYAVLQLCIKECAVLTHLHGLRRLVRDLEPDRGHFTIFQAAEGGLWRGSLCPVPGHAPTGASYADA